MLGQVSTFQTIAGHAPQQQGIPDMGKFGLERQVSVLTHHLCFAGYPTVMSFAD